MLSTGGEGGNTQAEEGNDAQGLATGRLVGSQPAGAAPGIPGSTPTATVVVTTHNRADLLAKALSSVANQTRRPQVVLVRAAGDTQADSLVPAALEIVDKTLSCDVGERASARNLGLAHAQGDYVLFLDDDDILAPWAIEALVANAEALGSPIIRGGRRVITSEERWEWPRIDVAPFIARPSRFLIGEEILTPSQTLYATSIVANLRFSEEVVPREDFLFGAEASIRAGSVAILPTALTGYRVHGVQSTSRYSPAHLEDVERRAREVLFARYQIKRRLRHRSMAHYELYCRSRLAYEAGDTTRGVTRAIRAAVFSPRMLVGAMWWKAVTLSVRSRFAS